jgi:hypothetical protein
MRDLSHNAPINISQSHSSRSPSFLISNLQPHRPLAQHSSIQRLPRLNGPLVRLILHKRTILELRQRDRADFPESSIPTEERFESLDVVFFGDVAHVERVVGWEVLVGDDGRLFEGLCGPGGGCEVAGAFGRGGCCGGGAGGR